MSQLEETLAMQMKWKKLLPFKREFKFATSIFEKRRWRFDFAWPDKKIAVEVEGGIWTGGAHTRGKHFLSDCEKYNAAAELGWRVFRFPEGPIKDGSAVLQIERVLDGLHDL